MTAKQIGADIVTLAAALGLSALDWWIDHTPSERVAGMLRLLIAVACVAAVLFAGGCRSKDGSELDGGVLSPPTSVTVPSAFVITPTVAEVSRG